MTATASAPALETRNNGNRVVWTANVPYESATLTVAIPGGMVIERTFSATDSISFSPNDVERLEIVDGSYSWQVVLSPVLSSATREKMAAARSQGDSDAIDTLVARGEIPAEDELIQSGSFRVANMSLVADTAIEPETQDAQLKGTGGVVDADDSTRDQVILDDLIVDGSACVGFDCVNGESFGFDTIRMKENNLRLHFDDTSNSASFPSNDWRIVANDSSNGGGAYLAIEDATAGRQIFRVDAGAPANSLRVDSAGDVGIGTSNAVVELHVADGDSPTLRLEQNGSSGFTPQTWDLAGNETNFFIRDVTNASKLPFRIKPGAPTNSLFIAANGDLGLGTAAPDADLDLVRSGQVIVEIEDTAGESWNIVLDSTGNNNGLSFTRVGSGVREFRIANDGAIFTGATQVHPDFVFSEEYDLMSLGDLEAFVKENKHLPRIPSADEVREEGLNMTLLQMRMLEKIEELTLYTLQQQETISSLESRLVELEITDE